jgi:hypothetical protein
MPKNTSLPDWEQVLSAAAHLQQMLPEAVLVGGTASAIHAQHRFSRDADHVLPDLRNHFDEILAQLEAVAGWKTARVQRPVQILGNLDGIETGIRQLIREQPLETTVVNFGGQAITVPTKEEILRIKGALIIKRNATRDYLDFVALADQIGAEKTAMALKDFDRLYPQPNEESALQQLQIQLSNPLPYDLEETRLTEYKNLVPKWQDWNVVKKACNHCATTIFDRVAALEQEHGHKEQGGPE